MSSLPLPSPLHTALPPRPWPGALSAVSPTLARTLLLALLLHVWLVLLLGNAPGGTAQPGQGVWGAINVTLRGPETPGVAEVVPPPLPTGPAGAAELPRWGGTVREVAPAAAETPGAARLGEWAATPPPALPVPAAPIAPIAPPVTAAVPLPAAPTPLPVPAPPTPTPTSTPTPTPTSPLPTEPAPPAERTLATPLPAALLPSPGLSAPAAVALPLALPAAAPALAEPLAALPVPRPPAVAEPISPPVPAPVLAPMPPTATAPMPALTRTAAPAVAPALAPVATPAALPETPVPRLPSPVPAATAGPVGRPDAGSQVGQDVATPPAAAASAPPRLNLQLARPRGGELSRFSSPGALPVLPRPPELPDKLAEDIAKSAKKDCRTAYPGAGLLAVVPLVAEAVRKDSGCKW